MSMTLKEIMFHLSKIAKAKQNCIISIKPESTIYRSAFDEWNRMGNSGQVTLTELEPEEGNLRLIPGQTQLSLSYTQDNQLYKFESLLMRLEQDPLKIVIRMPEKIETPKQRRLSQRIEVSDFDLLTLKFPEELQSLVPEIKATTKTSDDILTLTDPGIINYSKGGIAFCSNYRLDQHKKGDIISDAIINIPEYGETKIVLQIEHIETLTGGNYRFNCGCSITYFRQQEAEAAYKSFISSKK